MHTLGNSLLFGLSAFPPPLHPELEKPLAPHVLDCFQTPNEHLMKSVLSVMAAADTLGFKLGQFSTSEHVFAY
jgi:hypothetical protein